jgi:CheY-like chemotaxis protein
MTKRTGPCPPVILVVDDEALLRMLAIEHFEEAGYEVIEAEDGASALMALEARPDIQALFTDVQMPGRPDGFALARTVRETSPGCAIVVVSGRAAPHDDDLAEGVRFVTKPYWGSEIVSLISGMIGHSARP